MDAPNVAAVIIRKGGSVLLLRRSSTSRWAPGKWNLPMGHVEPGETPKQAAVRETKEESSLRVSGLIHVKDVKYRRSTVAYFKAKRFTGRPRIDFESSEWAWVPLSKLSSYDCVPGLRQALSQENPTMTDKEKSALEVVHGFVMSRNVKPSLKTAEAKRIVGIFYEAMGWRPDRYGNFLHPTKNDERIHFSKIRVQKQYKFQGTWSNSKTVSPVDFATQIVVDAAKLAGHQEMVDAWTKKKAAKKQAKVKATKKREDKTARQIAGIRAMKEMAFEQPRLLALAGYGVKLDEDVFQGLMKRRDELTDKHYDNLVAGNKFPDSLVASADRPPVLPLFYEPVQYLWEEIVDGVTYSIYMKYVGRGEANVNIGSAGPLGMTINPKTHRIEQAYYEAKGDAQISGRILFNGEMFMASLFMISSAAKQKGAGTRVLSIWCRMMAGYGIEAFRGEAVGKEGVAFLKALAAKNKIDIVSSRGSNVLVQCMAGILGDTPDWRPSEAMPEDYYASNPTMTSKEVMRVLNADGQFDNYARLSKDETGMWARWLLIDVNSKVLTSIPTELVKELVEAKKVVPVDHYNPTILVSTKTKKRISDWSKKYKPNPAKKAPTKRPAKIRKSVVDAAKKRAQSHASALTESYLSDYADYGVESERQIVGHIASEVVSGIHDSVYPEYKGLTSAEKKAIFKDVPKMAQHEVNVSPDLPKHGFAEKDYGQEYSSVGRRWAYNPAYKLNPVSDDKCKKMFDEWARLAKKGELMPHSRDAENSLVHYEELSKEDAAKLIECGKKGYASVKGHSREQWLIPIDRMGELEKRIARFEKKTAKLKLKNPIRFEVMGEKLVPVKDDKGKPTGEVNVFKIVELHGEAPSVSGYTFIARVQHTEAGNIVDRAPGVEKVKLPKTMWTAGPTCDHCKKVRSRNETFILRNDKTGKLIRVGRSCLADFLRSTDVEMALSIWSVIEAVKREQDEGEEEGGGGSRFFDMKRFLATTWLAIENEGWTSKTQAYESEDKTATVHTVTWAMFPMFGKITPQQADLWRKLQPKPKDIKTAEKVLKWARAIKPKNDYESNLKVAAGLDYVPPKSDGLIASMVAAYKRSIGDELYKKLAAKRASEKVNEWFGTTGSTYIRKLTVLRAHEINNDWGLTVLYVMEDEDGRSFKWFSSDGTINPRYGWDNPKRDENMEKDNREGMKLEPGDSLWFKFTIKKHDTWDNRKSGVQEKSTIITRAKVSEDKPSAKWFKFTTGEIFKTKKAMVAASEPKQNPARRTRAKTAPGKTTIKDTDGKVLYVLKGSIASWL